MLMRMAMLMAVAVVMTVMVVRRAHTLLPRGFLLRHHIDLHRSDAAGPDTFGGDANGTDAEREQILLDAQDVRAQVQQASQEHVASDAARHFDE